MRHIVIRRSLQVLAGTLAGLAVVAVLFLGTPSAPGGDAAAWPFDPVAPDPTVPNPYPAPDLPLVTAEGEPFAAGALQGRVSVVFFGFANCPDVCPITLGNLSRALDLLEPSGRGFQGIFVSVDPGRDTPEALRAYMKRFHPSLVALTGSEAAVAGTADAWGIQVSFVEEAERGNPHADHGADEARADPHAQHDAGIEAFRTPGYGVTHSTRALVVDRDGRVVRTLTPYLGPEDIVRVLEPLLR